MMWRDVAAELCRAGLPGACLCCAGHRWHPLNQGAQLAVDYFCFVSWKALYSSGPVVP